MLSAIPFVGKPIRVQLLGQLTNHSTSCLSQQKSLFHLKKNSSGVQPGFVFPLTGGRVYIFHVVVLFLCIYQLYLKLNKSHECEEAGVCVLPPDRTGSTGGILDSELGES